MPPHSHLSQKRNERRHKSVNVMDLMQKAKFNEKKEKRNTIIVTAAAISALAVSGFIISL